jgi:hypothetical protein
MELDGAAPRPGQLCMCSTPARRCRTWVSSRTRSTSGTRLITKFPQYNRYVLQSFSEGDPLSPDHNTA